MKYFLLGILLLPTSLLAQLKITKADTVRVVHTNYQTVFSKSLKYPVLVEWWDTRAKAGCSAPLKRKDQFAKDPALPGETDIAEDYVKSGTDRGHMCPAADNLCQTQDVETECFYFSNMAPQYHSLNAGDWKSLETLTRQLAIEHDSVKVWCGSYGIAKKIGPHEVSVPTHCWKVVWVKSTGEISAYLFENTAAKQTGVVSHKVDINIITRLTGFTFK
jgi:endonuclease G